MENITLSVEGMSCQHCVMAITNGVTQLDGVEEVKVNLEEASVFVSYNKNKIVLETIKETIEDLGYTVK